LQRQFAEAKQKAGGLPRFTSLHLATREGPKPQSDSGLVSGLIVVRASSIPTNPTLPGSLVAQGSNIGQITIFGSVGSVDQPGHPVASRTTQLADEAGHTLFTASGDLNSDPATRLSATPFAPLVASRGQGEIFLVAPKTGKIAQSIVGTATGPDSHIVFTSDCVVRLDTEAAPKVADQLGFDPAGSVGYQTQAPHKPLTIGIVRRTKDLLRTAELTSTSLRGSLDQFRFDPTHALLVFQHPGPAVPFRLRLSSFGKDAPALTFDSGPQHIGAGETATFDPDSWNSLRAVIMTGRDSAGHERRLVLPNQVATSQLGHILDLDIKKVPDRPLTRSLEVVSRMESLPPNSQVAISWLVLQRKRSIAHGARTLPAEELCPGRRRDSFVFSAPTSGRYEARIEIVVITLQGVIQSVSTASESACFDVE
jgi:hypothetical protein